MDDNNLITSFQVDHNRLYQGLYVSRIDQNASGKYVTTFDVRFFRPNKGRYMTAASMHSIEHLMATILRNRVDTKEKLIGLFPMGCLTGVYIVVWGKAIVEEWAPVLQEVLEAIVGWKGKVPGTNKINCGNYKMHDLQQAKQDCQEFLNAQWHYVYPMSRRLEVKGVGAFHDS